VPGGHMILHVGRTELQRYRSV